MAEPIPRWGFPPASTFIFAALTSRRRTFPRPTGRRTTCIRRTSTAAAGATGASIIYVLTDQSFNALGTAGGFVGSGYDASSLSTRVRINSHGTNEPYSVAEYSGIIYYVDQEGQVIRFQGGGGQSIS